MLEKTVAPYIQKVSVELYLCKSDIETSQKSRKALSYLSLFIY